MSLPMTTRHALAAQFGFKQKTGMHVQDNVIISDGFLIKDVEEALNIDAIQIYLDVHETDMLNLWHMLIDKIEGRPIEPINIDTTGKDFDEVLAEKKKDHEFKESFDKESERLAVANKPKRGRPFKNKDVKEETTSP